MEALRPVAVDLVQDMRRMLDKDSVTADRIEYHISILDRLLRGLMLVFRPNLDGNEILSIIASVQNVISGNPANIGKIRNAKNWNGIQYLVDWECPPQAHA